MRGEQSVTFRVISGPLRYGLYCFLPGSAIDTSFWKIKFTMFAVIDFAVFTVSGGLDFAEVSPQRTF